MSIYPFIRYTDPRRAVDWLERAFGLRRRQVHETPDGLVAHAELGLGSGLVMIGPRRGPDRPVDDDRGVYVVIDDVDAHHRQARAAGAEIVQAPFDTDYGSRDYAARDVEGNLWSFGTYRP
jgi:uncharacterized glyoxalase superfamily protein PhnB